MNEKIRNEIERMMGGRGFIKEPVIVCDRIYFLPDGGIELVTRKMKSHTFRKNILFLREKAFIKSSQTGFTLFRKGKSCKKK